MIVKLWVEQNVNESGYKLILVLNDNFLNETWETSSRNQVFWLRFEAGVSKYEAVGYPLDLFSG